MAYKHKDLTFWFEVPNRRGIPEVRSGRILMFMWSFGALEVQDTPTQGYCIFFRTQGCC